MENSFREENKAIFNLQVDEVSRAHMLETAKWMKFLGIISIIFISLFVIAMLFMGAAFSSLAVSESSSSANMMAGMGVAGTILYLLIILAFTVYPIMCMMKYSKYMKSAIHSSNQEHFILANGSIKSLFKFYGIIMIIFLGIYAIGIIFMGIGAAMM